MDTNLISYSKVQLSYTYSVQFTGPNIVGCYSKSKVVRQVQDWLLGRVPIMLAVASLLSTTRTAGSQSSPLANWCKVTGLLLTRWLIYELNLQTDIATDGKGYMLRV